MTKTFVTSNNMTSSYQCYDTIQHSYCSSIYFGGDNN